MSILKNACIIVNLERQARDCTAMEERIVLERRRQSCLVRFVIPFYNRPDR